MKYLKLLSVLLIIILTGCSNSTMENGTQTEDNQQRYIDQKITFYEAQEMLSKDVIILDVRTQEEFDDGHLINAIFMPYYEIKEKINDVSPDKEKALMVYCANGMKSEIVANQLTEMGYMNVFDIGGIDTWRGGIISSFSTYYNYFGESLPNGIPIDFAIKQKINEQLPEFVFHITGEKRIEYEFTADKRRYRIREETNIDNITVMDNDTIIQEFDNLGTRNFTSEKEQYGFRLDDWNFDGFLDISLRSFPGGSMRNEPSYYWLWDSNFGKFVENKQLEKLSDFSGLMVDQEIKQVTGYTREGGGYSIVYYEYKNGEFVRVKSYAEIAEYDSIRVITEELINGEMVVTED